MFCPKCGKEIQKDWTACPKCGEPVNLTDTAQNVKTKAPVKKKPIFKRWWFWVIVVLLMIFILIAFSGDEEETNKQAESENKSEHTDASVKNTKYTALELYQAVEDNDVVPFTLNDKARQFLKEHNDYFPTANYEHISADIDTSVEYKHVEKTPGTYGDKLMEVQELYVMSIAETDLENGNKFTEMEVVDEQENCYYIIYNGELENVFKEDIVSADILPLGITSYDNVSGGVTHSLVGAGAYVQKIE